MMYSLSIDGELSDNPNRKKYDTWEEADKARKFFESIYGFEILIMTER